MAPDIAMSISPFLTLRESSKAETTVSFTRDIEVVDIGSFQSRIRLKNEAIDRYELLKGDDIEVESAKIDKFMVSIACLY